MSRHPTNRRRCDVLLIHPPWFRFQGSTLLPYPVGPCHVASVLERAGIDALVWNGDFDPDAPLSIGGTNILKTDEMMRSHERYLARLKDPGDPIWQDALQVVEVTSPRAVGISAYSASFQSACTLASLIRARWPDMPIVLGGVHATIEREKCLETCEALDVVVVGEADETAPPLFEVLLREGRRAAGLGALRGIIHRGDGSIRSTPAADHVEDLDALPLPARHLLVDLDRMPPNAHQSLFGFRGCPFRCIFCGSFNVFGRKPRMRSAASMVDEIEMVHRTYGTRYFYLCDDIFLLDRERAREFCRLLRQKRLPIYYSVQSRGEMMAEEVLRDLKETGCQHIAVGVEVGDEDIRKRIKKGNTVEDMRRAAKLIRAAGLRMAGFFMFGFPWETREQMEKTAALMEELDPCVAFPYVVTPAVGTELHEIARDMGLLSGGVDYSSFHHESPRMGLTSAMPEVERREFLDGILERFARHNRASLRWDFFKRPRFYWAAAGDAGILSSPSAFFRHLRLLLR